jgi:fused signal recognition particle receptor
MIDFFKKHTASNETSFFNKLKNSLRNTKDKFSSQIENLFLGKKTIDASLLEELEKILLSADVGVTATDKIIKHLTTLINRNDVNNTETILTTLHAQLVNILIPCQQPLIIPSTTKPFVILTVGVNGAGKTTTIGKLAKQFQAEGKKVLLAAGDTFRAAAIEQLATWGQKNNIPVISQHTGADSASVVFDALQAAIARQYDILIADTAGRLHTKDNLMEELKKVIRVLKKLDPTAPHEVLLVLDASIGQNAIIQAEKFHQAVGVTGIALTKLDGTAKGGTLFSIATSLGLPFRYIGIGEREDDLKTFNAETFVQALFMEKNN